jgi:hypothetical protein
LVLLTLNTILCRRRPTLNHRRRVFRNECGHCLSRETALHFK